MKYHVLVGINYRPNPKDPERRAEPGDVVDDVPPKVAKVWLAEGVLSTAADAPAATLDAAEQE